MSSLHPARVAFARALASYPGFQSPRLSALKEYDRRESDGTRYLRYKVGDAEVMGSARVQKDGGYVVCIIQVDATEFPHTARYPHSWHHGHLTANPRRR